MNYLSSPGYKCPVRPLCHTVAGDTTAEGLLCALSDPVHAQILAAQKFA